MFDNNLNTVDPSDDSHTADNPGTKSIPAALRRDHAQMKA